MNDTLEVNGNADIDGVLKTDEIAESSTGSGITISNNIVSDVNIVGGDLDVNDNAGTGGNISADDITSRGDVGTVTVTATGTIEANNYTVQGNQFVPATCASGKFNRWDGNSWECEDDSAGGSGSGGANVLDDLDDVVITSSDTGDCIQYNGTNWVDIPCSTIAAASNVFEVTGAAGSELARQIAANVPIATSDFLFGGTTLDNQAGTDDDARMFFDKDRSAFRAGLVDGTQWDHAGANLNRGLYSAAFGQDTTASGAGSFAFGSNVGAGISATNTGSFAGGVSTSAPIISSGSGSFAFGATGSGGISATGTGAIALGDAVNATAGNTVAIGRDLSVSSIGSLGLGNDITISNTYSMGVGLGSVPFGANPIVSGANSAAFFMGSHTGGLNMTASNTFGIFGGRMVIDPTVPATVLAPATGGAEATDGDLELHVVGDIGAGQYCDEAGDTCFQAGRQRCWHMAARWHKQLH